MWDRQYIRSLAISVVVGTIAFGLLVGALAWSGWKGALGLLAVGGGFLFWFYRGPRPDVRRVESKPVRGRTAHD